jgi:hypothetical protein
MTHCRSKRIRLKRWISGIINEIKEISSIGLDLKNAAVLFICQDETRSGFKTTSNTTAAKRDTQ